MSTSSSPLILLAVISLSSAPSLAQITFTKIADTNTAIPGGNGTFAEIGRFPSLDASKVAFSGSSAGSVEEGIYVGDSTSLNVVADLTTMVPAGMGTFSSLGSSDLSGENVVFDAGGIYFDDGDSLSVVADTSTVPPGNFRNFVSLRHPAVDGSDVGFSGRDGFDIQGLYFDNGQFLAVLTDNGDSVPGQPGKAFVFFDGPCMDGRQVAFVGWWRQQFTTGHGVYSQQIGSPPVLVADTSTAIPDGTGSFTGLGFASIQNFGGRRCSTPISGGHVAFEGRGENQNGIYVHDGMSLSVVADLGAAIPEGPGTFTDFGIPSISGEHVAFLAEGSAGQQGIYLSSGDSLMKVIDLSDPLEGKTLSGLGLSAKGFDGEEIAFHATFTDSSQGIFVATVPLPEASSSAMLASGIGILVMLAHRRNRFR